MASNEPSSNFRQIRSVHTKDTIRVYQAYNDKIANAAIAANSFRAPLEAGIWSKNRMTWIKPSKIWMAYRCGWTVLKDDNQSRVLALDLSRGHFEDLLRKATVTHHGDGGKNTKKKKCRESDVVVQWDPERTMNATAHGKQVFTSPIESVRSIQIGLRGSAVELLLDEKFVMQISDVTQHFRDALKALKAGDVEMAELALYPDKMGKERVMHVPSDIRRTLYMDEDNDAENNSTATAQEKKRLAVVVLGSAANPPHMGHFHCLRVGKKKAEELGYHVLFTTLAIAPYGYVRKKMERQQKQQEEDTDINSFVLSDSARLHLLDLLTANTDDDGSESEDKSGSDSLSFKAPSKCFGSALECGRALRPSDDVTVVIVVGGDRSKMKWRKSPKNDQITICCARDQDQITELHESFESDKKNELVLDDKYHFAIGVGPPTSSTMVRSILQSDSNDKIVELIKHGYSNEAAVFLCSETGG